MMARTGRPSIIAHVLLRRVDKFIKPDQRVTIDEMNVNFSFVSEILQNVYRAVLVMNRKNCMGPALSFPNSSKMEMNSLYTSLGAAKSGFCMLRQRVNVTLAYNPDQKHYSRQSQLERLHLTMYLGATINADTYWEILKINAAGHSKSQRLNYPRPHAAVKNKIVASEI